MVMKGGTVIPPSTRQVARANVAENVRRVRAVIEEHGFGRTLK
jgi:hypothetical protein